MKFKSDPDFCSKFTVTPERNPLAPEIDPLTMTIQDSAKIFTDMRERELQSMLDYHQINFEDIKDRLRCEMAPAEGIEVHYVDDKKALTFQRVINWGESPREMSIKHEIVRHYKMGLN